MIFSALLLIFCSQDINSFLLCIGSAVDLIPACFWQRESAPTRQCLIVASWQDKQLLSSTHLDQPSLSARERSTSATTWWTSSTMNLEPSTMCSQTVQASPLEPAKRLPLSDTRRHIHVAKPEAPRATSRKTDEIASLCCEGLRQPSTSQTRLLWGLCAPAGRRARSRR